MTTSYAFPPPPQAAVPVAGGAALFPVHRIFCVGRNYAEHAKEMGFEVDREAPFYFTKPASAVFQSGGTAAYPPGTANFHHEMELVVALGAPAFRVTPATALDSVFGYAAGLDMTRRDLQQAAREKGRPWDIGKAFEQSAVMAEILPRDRFTLANQAIRLSVNGQVKQDSDLSQLIFSVPELIADLSKYYHLGAGDLIYTGTPAGVGPVRSGDVLEGAIEGLPPLRLTIGAAD